jgi:hypothetical protein
LEAESPNNMTQFLMTISAVCIMSLYMEMIGVHVGKEITQPKRNAERLDGSSLRLL